MTLKIAIITYLFHFYLILGNLENSKSRLSKFLEENKCLFSRQFGFRNKHLTNHVLIDLTETIRKAIDDNEFACGVFLDFKKAFDTVNHEILKKLEHEGNERACFKMVHLLS